MFENEIHRMSRDRVEQILEENGYEPTGQEDGDRDWLYQLYRNGELDKDPE